MAGAAVDGNVEDGAHGRSARAVPLAQLLLYYAGLVLVGGGLAALVPGAREALVAPVGVPLARDLDALFTGGQAGGALPPPPWPGAGGRGALALIAVVGALTLALPVAWVHMRTRRLRSDASLVHAVIVLPIVVAGVVLVVKNSLALAFALAGIVAGVRFRQKLNEPQEAVYVLLALGIGLAAGVQALDVALVMSLSFNLVVLGLWRYDVGALHAGGFNSDGVLVVRARDPDAAMRGVAAAVGRVARDWRFTEPVPDDRGQHRFEVRLRLKKGGDPAALLAELKEDGSDHIAAAEYRPGRGESGEG